MTEMDAGEQAKAKELLARVTAAKHDSYFRGDQAEAEKLARWSSAVAEIMHDQKGYAK